MSARLAFQMLVCSWSGSNPNHLEWRRGGRTLLVGLLAAIATALIAVPGAALASSDPSPVSARYDLSFPECHGGYTPPEGSLIVGVNGGRPFTKNPCFTNQLQVAHSRGEEPAFYLNLSSPSGPGVAEANNGPRGVCKPHDEGCRSYNFGYHAARYADQYARSQQASPHTWWLDIETANHWSHYRDANDEVIQGAIDYFKQQGVTVGIYSIASMWHTIAGDYAPGVPNWVVQTRTSIPTLNFCESAYSFGGGQVVMVQHWDGHHDVDYACPGRPKVAAPARAPTAAAPPKGPATLGTSASGHLVGSKGGSSAFYNFDYWGGNKNETVTITYSPHGIDTTNGFFVTLTQNGTQLAKIRASDFRTPGQIRMDFSSDKSGPVTVQLVNYNDPGKTPPISYTIKRTS